MAEKILVLGATGNVGRHLVKALLERGEQVKAASRSGQPMDRAEGVAFDFLDEASIAASLERVKAIYVLAPTGQTDAMGVLMPVITAAAKRNVKVVLQTAIGVDADERIPFRQVELALERSGTPFVILRPNWFSDNFHNMWRHDIARGDIRAPAGDGQTSFIDARDIADSAARALMSAEFDGQSFVLTGPEALDYTKAAALISKVSGKPMTYTPIDDETFIAALTAAGVPEPYAQVIDRLFFPVRQGWTAQVTTAVLTLAGHPPRTVENYLRDRAALQV